VWMASPCSMFSTAAAPAAMARIFEDMPLGDRRKRLARLRGSRQIAHCPQRAIKEDGTLLFVHARRVCLEGIVSKRLTHPIDRGL
jgi:ATP-dependent DNA ligase